jgi:hypothetical protein
MEKALAAVRQWGPERQNEAAELLLAIDRLGLDAYHASPEELAAIDAALAQVARGDYASEAGLRRCTDFKP